MLIVDTHAHLDQIENLGEALDAARQVGVEGVVAVSMDLVSSRKNLEIVKKDYAVKIYLALGMHPSEANLDDLDEIVALIRQSASEISAIGEIGLDFWYKWARKDSVKQDEQRRVFQTFLELAKELNVPVSIHSRGAWKECLEMTKAVGIKKAVFHWYSGPIDVLKDLLACPEYYVSATPSLAYSPQVREAIEVAPIERTVLETDSPVHYKDQETGKRFSAEPKDVLRTFKAYCVLKDVDEEKAFETLNQNVKNIFGSV